MLGRRWCLWAAQSNRSPPAVITENQVWAKQCAGVRMHCASTRAVIHQVRASLSEVSARQKYELNDRNRIRIELKLLDNPSPTLSPLFIFFVSRSRSGRRTRVEPCGLTITRDCGSQHSHERFQNFFFFSSPSGGRRKFFLSWLNAQMMANF